MWKLYVQNYVGGCGWELVENYSLLAPLDSNNCKLHLLHVWKYSCVPAGAFRMDGGVKYSSFQVAVQDMGEVESEILVIYRILWAHRVLLVVTDFGDTSFDQILALQAYSENVYCPLRRLGSIGTLCAKRQVVVQAASRDKTAVFFCASLGWCTPILKVARGAVRSSETVTM